MLPLLFDGLVEILAELALEHAVIMLDLLLLAQVDAVVGELAAALTVHARRGSRGARIAHFGVSQRVPLRNSFRPSRRQSRQTGPVYRAMSGSRVSGSDGKLDSLKPELD